MINDIDHVLLWKKFFDTFLNQAHKTVNTYKMFKPNNPSEEAEFKIMQNLVDRAKELEPHYPDVPILNRIKERLKW